MATFLNSLLGKKVKTTTVDDAGVEAAKLLLDARVNRMLDHHRQNTRTIANAALPPLVG